ncbi:MAG: hypothetical protein WC637_21660 [Victivallales bacterium]
MELEKKPHKRYAKNELQGLDSHQSNMKSSISRSATQKDNFPFFLKQWRILGNWEPKMFLQRRGDGSFCDLDTLWRDIHSDHAIQRMKKIGVNLSHIHFHKGYGLEHEKESIAEAKAWSERLRENGIAVGVYIGSTFFYEAFRHPDYEKMITQNGAAGWSASQYFRKGWCYNSPEAFDYFKEVIRVAIKEVEADILHFDNSFCDIYDLLCHCDNCVNGFHRFVRDEIPEIAKAAGYDSPYLLLPPPSGNREHFASLSELREPGAIAWALYHAESGTRAFRRFADFARGLRPDIAILFNGADLCGISSLSYANHEMEKMVIADITCVEDSLENPVIVTEDGMPVSRFRAYKVGARTKTRVCYYTTGEKQDNCLMLAEAAVFNYRSLGFVETAMQANHKVRQEDEPLLRYLVDHEPLFVEREPWHNIAVLRHHESQLLNPYPSGLSPYVVEQMLFEDHAPFAIIGEKEIDLAFLSARFDLVILPDCKCLSEKEIFVLEEYVQQGGRLLSIGVSATATPLNHYRPAWGLSRIFNHPGLPAASISSYEEVATNAGAQKSDSSCLTLTAEFGQGRAMHIPGLAFRLPDKSCLTRFAGYDWYYHPYWKAPANADLFRDAVRSLITDKWRLRTDLLRHVGVETYTIANGYRVQFVNYRHPDPTAACKLTLKVPEAVSGSVQATWEAPEGTRMLSHRTTAEGSLEVELPSFTLLATLSVCMNAKKL